MLILALDCSTSRGTVAIAELGADDTAGAPLWERVFPAGRGHGGELFTTLQAGLRAVGAGSGGAAGRLGRIVVGLGPGSYSGVRQSIAVVTGLSLATGATLRGLPSTLALETGAPDYHAIGDARRGTIYYTAVAHGRLADGPDLLDGPAALLERLARHPGWPVLVMEEAPPALPAGVETATTLPSAARLLAAGPSAYQSGILEPIYLRPPTITLPKAPGAATGQRLSPPA